MGFTSLYLKSGSTAGFAASVIVSPNMTSATFLIPVTMYPTSPAFSDACGTSFNCEMPTSFTE
jgi:hypothetical protein